MYIVSLKLDLKKILSVIAVCCIAFAVLIAALPARSSDVLKNNSNKTAKSTSDHVLFLKEYGYDVSQKPVQIQEIIIPDDGYTLKPQEFILGSTFQSVYIPSTLVGIVNGKSSLGRLGVMIHVTAGYIDPGFIGNITLELFNVSNKPFVLMSGMKICQLILESVSSECFRPYGSNGLNSHYQNSKGVVNSRFEYE